MNRKIKHINLYNLYNNNKNISLKNHKLIKNNQKVMMMILKMFKWKDNHHKLVN